MHIHGDVYIYQTCAALNPPQIGDAYIWGCVHIHIRVQIRGLGFSAKREIVSCRVLHVSVHLCGLHASPLIPPASYILAHTSDLLHHTSYLLPHTLYLLHPTSWKLKLKLKLKTETDTETATATETETDT